MKVVIKQPTNEEILDNKVKKTNVQTLYEEAEFDELQEEIRELERAGLNVDVTVNGKMPKE